MTHRRRNALLLLGLAALLALAWWTRARWLPGLLVGIEANATLISALEALVNIGGVLIPAVLVVLAYLGFIRRPAPPEPLSLLRPVTLDELRRSLGRDGGISYISRSATHPDDLMRCRRLVITGVPKVGKTREAIELIGGAIRLDLMGESRVFQPTPHLRGTDPQAIASQVLKDVQSTTGPLLLLLDDLPREYRPGELDRLGAVLNRLKDCPLYVVATARLDQLESKHTGWLAARSFETIHLAGLEPAQVARLTDNAAGMNNVQMDEDARQALIEGSDGTPELTLLTFRRMAEADVRAADRAVVAEFAASSVIQQWHRMRQDIIGRHPEVSHLLRAVAVFYAARVTPYTDLVLALATRRMSHVARIRLWLLLPRLATYNIRQEDSQFRFKDYMAEAEEVGSEVTARKELADFVLHHNRLLRLLRLGNSAKAGERQVDALVTLASAFERDGYSEDALRLSNTANQIQALERFFIRRGNLHANQGREVEALADYGEAIRLHPTNYWAFAFRGRLHADHDREAEALADYNEAIRLDPTNDWAFYNRGRLHVQHSREAEALADFTEAIRLDPTNDWVFYNRGRLHADHDREAEALADFTEAIRLDPTNDWAFRNRGRLHADHDREAEALADYGEAIRLDPTNDWVFVNRGRLHAQYGREAEALADYDEAIRLDPTDAWVFVDRGRLHADHDREAEALADFTEAIRLDPTNDWAFRNRGRLHSQYDRQTEALADYDEAIRLDPTDAWVFVDRGRLHAQYGRETEALTDFTEAIRLDPTNDWAFRNRGRLHSQYDRQTEALADYDEAIRLDPNDAGYYYNRGDILRRLDRHAEAVCDFEQSARLGRDTSGIHMNLAGCYRDLGRADGAARHVALARERVTEDGLYNRACIEAIAGNDNLALDLLARALEAGKVNRDWVRRDPDWRSLREDPRFRQLVGEAPEDPTE